jgi:cytoskeletal protein RodZ
MPIKDKVKARGYFKNYMAHLRAKEKGLTNEKENVKPCEDIVVKPQEGVKPKNDLLNPRENVKPNSGVLNLCLIYML